MSSTLPVCVSIIFIGRSDLPAVLLHDNVLSCRTFSVSFFFSWGEQNPSFVIHFC